MLSRTQQKTDQVHVGYSVEKMQAVPNHLQKAKDWSCNLLTVTPLLTTLWLFFQFMSNMKRSGDKTHPCWSAVSTVNGCDRRNGHKPLSRNTVTWRSVKSGRNSVLPQHSPQLFT